jgi:DNA-binding SARP family transcriptional activator
MPRLSLGLLGPFRARRETGEAVVIRRRKAQALLAYLALRRGKGETRERLIALLWEDLEPARGRHSLRQTLTELRRDLGEEAFSVLVVDGDAIALRPGRVSVDAEQFERLAAGTAGGQLREAAALYGGDLLEGAPGGGQAFEMWLADERHRLRAILVDVLDRLLADRVRSGSSREAVRIATRLLGIDPCREDVHRTLMRLHAAAGRRAAALRQYRSCVAALRRELDIAPERETTDLYRAIRDDRPGGRVVVGALPDPSAPPLVGRDREIGRLRGELAAAWDGVGRAILIRGAAGVGKSRLVEELTRRAAAKRGRVLVARAHESEQVLPFGLWASLLHEARLTAEPALLAGIAPADRHALACLLPDATRGVRPAADPVAPTRLLAASHALLVALAARGPMALIFEDLQWADELSIRLFGFLARRTSGVRLFLLGTGRDEDIAANLALSQVLAGGQHDASIEEIALGPLTRDAAAHLARALLGGAAVRDAPGIVERMWELSEGNPFVLVESARAMRDAGPLPDAGPLSVPPSVRDLIRGRLRRLDGRARLLLEACAVIGREFELPFLRDTVGWPGSEVAQTLGELVRRQFLEERGRAIDFSHQRLRDVVYESLSGPERQELHDRVATALERRHAGELAPLAARLGAHCRDAHAWDRAARYYRLAADVAVERAAHAGAEALLGEALAAAERIEDRRARLEQSVDLHLAFERVLTPQGDLPGVLAHLCEAEAGALALGDRRRLGWVAAQRIFCAWWQGDGAAARAAGEQALEIAASLADPALAIVSRHHLAQLYFHVGEYDRGVQVCRELLDALPEHASPDSFGQAVPPAVQARVYLSACLGCLGDVATAQAVGEAAIRLAERAGHRFATAFASYALGSLELGRGRLLSARQWLERAMDLQRQLGEDSRFLSAGGALGFTYVQLDRLAEGVALIEQATEASARQGLRYPHQRNLGFLGHARLREGRVAEALECAEEALSLARRQKHTVAEARALHLLAQVLAAASEPGSDHTMKAVAACRGAQGLARASKLDFMVARCEKTLTQLLERQRDLVAPRPPRRGA